MAMRTVGLLVVLGLCSTAVSGPEDYAAARKRYEQLSSSRSLYLRTRGQEILAETRHPGALETLAGVYAKPRAPITQARHLLVNTIARNFDDPQFTAALANWRSRFKKHEDAWLWYRTLVVHGRHRGSGELLRLAREEKVAYLRAAAIEALATLGHGEVVLLASELLQDLPRKPADRAVLVESLAHAVCTTSVDAKVDARLIALKALIAQLDDPKTHARTRVVLARCLARRFKIEETYVDGASWRAHLENPDRILGDAAGRLKEVSLAGTETGGMRICYLLDTSDASTDAATDEDRLRLMPSKAGAAALASASRFTLMREAVRASLARLQPEQSFIVLYYSHGQRGAPKGCERMMQATSANIAKVLESLETVPVQGGADLHGGLQLAYQAGGKQLVRDNEHVAPAALLGGCDTLFVLSHSPSIRDQWVAAGDGGGIETGRTLPDGRRVNGLYADPKYLADEVRRLNLFRKTEVHAIGFGDAQADSLDLVSRVASGRERDASEEDEEQDIAEAPPRPPPREDPALRDALKEYDAWLKRPSFYKRTQGRMRLARSKSLGVLEVLAKSYGRAEDPVPLVQATIVDICYDRYRAEGALPIYARWRGAHSKRMDAWLWRRALEIAWEYEDHEPVLRTARDAHDPFLQAAAIRAMIGAYHEDILGRIPGWVARIRDAKPETMERILPVEAMAVALAAFGDLKDEDRYKQAALALLDVFDDEKTPKRTKLAIVRNLAAGLEVPPEGLQKAPWVRETRAGGSGVGMADHRYGAPTFAGLRASGTRICYVIDLSDSMLTPLKPEERIKPKVVTGAKGRQRPEDEIPWDRVRNRFELARELLKASLRGLRPGTHYSVIWFGSDAKPLDTTRGLVETTPKNVERTIRELMRIKPGPPGSGEHKTQVKWGALRGETNLHGGMVRAFTRTSNRPLTGFTYVAKRGVLDGCDTIFLLTDGVPSTDDHCAVDKRDPEDHAVKDRESMERTKDTPTLTFPGPYGHGRWPYLLYDVERRNLFRQVEIHCIGIGEADMSLLQQLANIGLGKARQIGQE